MEQLKQQQKIFKPTNFTIYHIYPNFCPRVYQGNNILITHYTSNFKSNGTLVVPLPAYSIKLFDIGHNKRLSLSKMQLFHFQEMRFKCLQHQTNKLPYNKLALHIPKPISPMLPKKKNVLNTTTMSKAWCKSLMTQWRF